MAASYYDYSQLRANGVTPSAVYANGQPVYRLLANGVDIIHKRTGYTMNYRFGFRFNLSIRKEKAYRTEEWWNCGWKSESVFDHWEVIANLSPVKDIRESNGDGYISNVGWYHENRVYYIMHDIYGNSTAGGGGHNTPYYHCFNMGQSDIFHHMTVVVDKDVCNVRWSLDRPESQYHLNATGDFTSGGTCEIWGHWATVSKTIQEY